MAPLPRYLYARCCEDKDHVAGLESPDHRAKMREEVERSRQHLKDFAWTCGMRNTKVLNHGKTMVESTALEEDDDRHLWSNDPVHPASSAYEMIAGMLIEQAGALKGGGNKGKGGAMTEQSNKRPKISPSREWGNSRGAFARGAYLQARGGLYSCGGGWTRGVARPRRMGG
jgi:hypothetical protein